MKASDICFTGTRFSKSEWPVDENGKSVLENMDASVLEALFRLRRSVPADCFMTPSPLVRAHIRNESTGSRHSLQEGSRLSDATDFYVPRRYASLVWLKAMGQDDIGGVGIYQHSFLGSNTNGLTLFHIDTRPQDQKTCWIGARENRSQPFKYISYSSPEAFFRAMSSMEGLFR